MTQAAAVVAESPAGQTLESALQLLAGGYEPEAQAALEDVRRRHPHRAEPHLRLAALHRGAGRPEQAVHCYEAVLACDPQHHAALLALGAMHVSAGRAGLAEPLLRRCCAQYPADAQARHTLGLALLLLEQTESAWFVLRAAHDLDRSNPLCAVHLADASHALGRGEAGRADFEASLRSEPGNAGILTGLAASLTHLGRRDEAIDVLEAATLLQPDAVVPSAMFADMLARTTRAADAEIALRRALLLDPGNEDASMALSVVLMRLHRYIESLALLQDLLDRGVESAGPLCNMSTVLTALGRQEEAVARARDAIAAAPDHASPRRALCNALPYSAGIDGVTLLAASRDCAERQPRGSVVRFGNDPDPARRLKVGLLSGTLRTHPVGWLTIAAFEQLDPAAYELVALSSNTSDDAIGRRFAAITTWQDTAAHDDAALAQHIRDLGIDMLIDLGGYGDLGRMQVCAHRAAPVQIKWVGMQNHSTGIAAMDWFISDRWETPARLAHLYTERLMLLRDGYVCYSPPEDAPDVAPAPCLARGAISFGCYNNLAKITPDVVAVWSRILHATAGSRLILKTHQFNHAASRDALRAGFAAHGIEAARVVLRGSSPHRELLRQYADVDVVLDPFPYSGGLTTCEALWMGVPTLTMPGETFASRHSSSHMSNIGLPDWIVADSDAYVARAISLAADPAGLATLRAGLRARVQASPLCDAPRFGASLDMALRAAWADWCCRRPDIYPLL